MLWLEPLGRMRARLVWDVTVFTGLDALTLPLLQQLARTRRPGSIVVIEPDGSHPLLAGARATGARIMVADPASPRILLPVLAGRSGCALRYLYAHVAGRHGQRGHPDHGQRDPEAGTSLTWNGSRTSSPGSTIRAMPTTGAAGAAAAPGGGSKTR